MPKIITACLNYFKRHQRQILLITASFIIGILLFVSVFSYIDYKQLAQIILRFSWWKFIIFLIASLFALILSTFRWQMILSARGYEVSFWRLLQYRLAGFGFSYLTPVAELGGAPFRAYLLKNQGVPFDQGLVTVIVDNFIEVTTQGFLVTLGILTFLGHFGLSHRLEWLLAISAFSFLAFTIWLFSRLRRGKFLLAPFLRIFQKRRFFKSLLRFEKYFVEFFTHHKATTIKAFLLSLVGFISGIMEVGVLLYLMGYSLGILNTFLIKIIFNIAVLFPVPASLGVSEWAQATFFATTVAGKSAGFAFSVLTKAKNLFYAFLGIGLFAYWWHKRVRIDRYLINYLRQKIHG